jgi:hypothetical protein
MSNTIRESFACSNPEPIEPPGDEDDGLDLDDEMLEFEASEPQSVKQDDSQATIV